MMPAMSDVTRILEAIGDGDQQALEKLLPLVYDELRRLAAANLARESPGQTLQATALVHEAYLKLVGTSEPRFETRGHFFTAAAEAMRRILIDRARSKGRQKRGGKARRLELHELDLALPPPDDDLLALDEALARLEQEDRPKAELVKLRFFAGLSVEQAAAALGISRATADRYWRFARAWLFHEIAGTEPPES
jgi:RNA polymerase sigma factor (TIGR02999 family)